MSRRILPAGLLKKSDATATASYKDNPGEETLYPVGINDITVTTEEINDIILKPDTDLIIEWN